MVAAAFSAVFWCHDASAREPWFWGDGNVHGLLGVAGGWCTRGGLQVGGNVPCVETSLALDIPLPRRPDLHWLIESGFGITAPVRWGYSTLGEETSTGGGNVLLRTMFGRDFESAATPNQSALLFWRFGGEAKPMWAVGSLTWGFHGLVDLGTRIDRRFELGVRLVVGADTVSTVGPDYTATDWSFFIGTQLFGRFVVR